ncbi:RNA ligase family protein [Salinirubrum litoreum]|uniref:RNA ligase family protein n=1 Tax=Salinirubrum litoreum TaxID=1126234 RepID=A0ABD5RG47_9EURY|nr:RNA ligase family protein [Salinirubrum litoreum]
MKAAPPIPRLADAPDDVFETGHLWLLEHVVGDHLRFRLQPSGQIQFGDRTRVFDAGDPPTAYEHAVSHVRERLDRDRLRQALDDPSSVVFYGEAMHAAGVDYDWERTPSFLGDDVWSADRERFRPPDATEQIFEQVGLHPVNAVEKERNGRDFDPESYAFPQSAWYDGPVAGVVVRNKRGGRALLRNPAVETDRKVAPVDGSPAEVATEVAPTARFDRLSARLADEDRAVTFQSLYDLTLETVLRANHERLTHSQSTVDLGAFRGALAARTRAYLAETG